MTNKLIVPVSPASSKRFHLCVNPAGHPGVASAALPADEEGQVMLYRSLVAGR